MAAGKSSLSKTAVWIIIGLLFIGLAGFGATNMSGTVRSIGTAGDQTISVDSYVRELQREMRAIESQTGQPLSPEMVRLLRLDQTVLARLVALASLDHEVDQLGLSVGDTHLQQEILRIPAFRGIDGEFDRDTYRFALSQANLREAEFEDDLRAESARTILQGAVTSGVKMPPQLADTITTYVASRRSFAWARLDASTLSAPVAEPTTSELRTYYDANTGDFQLPERRKLTYALLTPDMLLEQAGVEDSAVRALYDERSALYQLPERRLVERLVFGDEAAANEAMSQLDIGATTFPGLVNTRGLELSDVDLGDITAEDLGSAAEAVFGAEMGAVVGPLKTDLGPALFRINGILAARKTPFEDVVDELTEELATERGRRMIEGLAQDMDDRLAGGATLEDLAAETDMTLGQLDWTEDTRDGPAGYPAFNEEVAGLSTEDFPSIKYLEDGGIFAVRLDEITEAGPEPFESAQDRVEDAWTQDQILAALQARAEEILAETGDDLQSAGLDVTLEDGLTRTAFIEGTPPGFMNDVFKIDVGARRAVTGDNAVFIVRVDEELPPEATSELGDMRRAITQQMDQALSTALFEALVRDAQLRARPLIDQQALAAVQANFQ